MLFSIRAITTFHFFYHFFFFFILGDGSLIASRTVVITTGTFLRAQINIGLETVAAGRMGDEPTVGLARTLESLQFQLGRLKTGTPPRLDGKTINYSACSVQPGDNPPVPFSFMNDRVWLQVGIWHLLMVSYHNVIIFLVILG